ncbi:unnamed protein product [Mycena citricolor]|uniref:Rab proteins geranylgeranyltransferase n=1 Tax=Mycena citricolor TaxID=2018698 RepID=A0AAD2HCA8_9AGAR|nr:unnamed protein product [Mycena citricolor]CAK5272962.1 unnamed protein product [Mycena citricolor]
MDSEASFDVIILGTGLTESIVAAALAKAGLRIAHIDENAYYGGRDACLSFEDLVNWQNSSGPEFSIFTRSSDAIAQPRSYSLSLSPSVIPSSGPLIDTLVASGVSRYGGFRLIERICVYDAVSTSVKLVPGSKEDIFKSKEITLVEKRRIMRFLTFAAGDFENSGELQGHFQTPFPQFLRDIFSLNMEMADAIAYALAYCLTSTDPTLLALHRLRRYLRSAGRYGTNPFLVGHYGSSGEIAQGFCRTAAVSGAVYVLGRSAQLSTDPISHRHVVQLDDFPESLSCTLLIASQSSSLSVPPPTVASSPFTSSTPNFAVARSILIIDQPLALGSEGPVVDTGIVVFPPACFEGASMSAAATALVTGEGTLSCPKGQWIVYLTLPLPENAEIADPEKSLRPYYEAILALGTGTPLFSTFYLQKPAASRRDSDHHVSPTNLPPVLPLPDAGDAAALHAEDVFRAVLSSLRPNDTDVPFWPPLEASEDGEDE